MIESQTWWRIAAVVYTIINAGGVVFAAAMREPAHAGVHLGLLVLGLGAYLVWRPKFWAKPADNAPAQLGDERLDYLQQSVDAIALEVERIGEKQRFNDKLRSERGEISPVSKPPREEPPA